MLNTYEKEQKCANELADKSSDIGFERQGQALAHLVVDSLAIGVEGALALPGGSRRHLEDGGWILDQVGGWWKQ